MHKESLKKFISSHFTMSIASVDGDAPWICTVFYIPDGLTLYFVSGKNSKHSNYFKNNPNAAVTIYDHDSKWGEVTGAQLGGTVEELGFKETVKLLPRFVKELKSDMVPDDFEEVKGSRIYKFVAKKAFYRNSDEFKSMVEVEI